MNHTLQAAPGQTSRSAYYEQQYNVRAMIPEHPYIYTRWGKDSMRVRRTTLGLFDLTYGESPAERLDFFPASRRDAPLLVYIHGGWWRTLDKSDFSFIAPAYTHAGINVALTNYTLAPNATIEEIVVQQLHAVAWLYRNAEKYQFDPQRIVVAGHSAGAHLAAMLQTALWSVFAADLPPDLVKAGILLSGLYDLAPIVDAEFVNIDLRLTPQRAALLSPSTMPQAHAIPFLTAVGGLESDEFKRQNGLIGAHWRNSHTSDIALPSANHLTICDAFGNVDDPLFNATTTLIAGLQTSS